VWDEKENLSGQQVEQSLDEGARDTTEPAVGVEERRPRVDADRGGHRSIVRRHRVTHVAMASVRGGLLRVMESLAGEQRRDHEVRLLSPSPPSDDAGLAACWSEWTAFGNADLGAHLRLLQALRSWQTDAVILHAGSPGELALATALARPLAHTVVVEHLPEYYPRRRTGSDLLLRTLKRRASLWVSVSEAGARALERSWRLPQGTLKVLHNGVAEPERGGGPPVTDVGRESMVVAFGRREPRKGFDTFVTVAATLVAQGVPARWLWVGAEVDGRDGVVELRHWSDGIGAILHQATLVLLPSRTEGLPLVLLEAMACAVPVVASAVGGIPEVLIDGKNGILVAPEDVAGWVDRVGRLLGAEENRAALARAARKTWEERFTAGAMARRYEVELQRLWAA
jgi:glycosyltransferase involved in cell wall biosynthesis